MHAVISEWHLSPIKSHPSVGVSSLQKSVVYPFRCPKTKIEFALKLARRKSGGIGLWERSFLRWRAREPREFPTSHFLPFSHEPMYLARGGSSGERLVTLRVLPRQNSKKRNTSV